MRTVDVHCSAAAGGEVLERCLKSQEANEHVAADHFDHSNVWKGDTAARESCTI